ncbi:hypothetical protein JOB18_039242 [Solea senegalensis]|uniref:Uncharacterized protein n=1 Tax=Solea senegalensis TaxID=28829 RepID=A0AAV6T1P0_SOLSE|nr:hypothetical protein JOB18_039242 [Solea senegalensis]
MRISMVRIRKGTQNADKCSGQNATRRQVTEMRHKYRDKAEKYEKQSTKYAQVLEMRRTKRYEQECAVLTRAYARKDMRASTDKCAQVPYKLYILTRVTDKYGQVRARTKYETHTRVQTSTEKYESTDKYAQVLTSNRVLTSTHKDKYGKVQTSTDMYAQVLTSVHKYRQVQTRTDKYKQGLTSTDKYESTDKYGQVLTCIDKHKRQRERRLT